MNFLAHLYLSGNNPEVMVGNFIGDFVKGRDLTPVYGIAIANGIVLHRAIDDFTDHHPIVKQSRSRLFPVYRHYSAVIVDIFYDHFLAANWDVYSKESLDDYAARAYQVLLNHETIVPPGVNQMLSYMIRGNWLVNYGSIEGIQKALTGMARRATFESKMQEATADLERSYDSFQSEFDQFFPELKKFCDKRLLTLTLQ
ncbi:acyl carrier protein phosphodiesterase [soil metagenome]